MEKLDSKYKTYLSYVVPTSTNRKGNLDPSAVVADAGNRLDGGSIINEPHYFSARLEVRWQLAMENSATSV